MDDSRDELLEEFHAAGIWLPDEHRPTKAERLGRAGSGFALMEDLERITGIGRIPHGREHLVSVTPEFLDDLLRRAR